MGLSTVAMLEQLWMNIGLRPYKQIGIESNTNYQFKQVVQHVIFCQGANIKAHAVRLYDIRTAMGNPPNLDCVA
jgi:hypothetical protein